MAEEKDKAFKRAPLPTAKEGERMNDKLAYHINAAHKVTDTGYTGKLKKKEDNQDYVQSHVLIPLELRHALELKAAHTWPRQNLSWHMIKALELYCRDELLDTYPDYVPYEARKKEQK